MSEGHFTVELRDGDAVASWNVLLDGRAVARIDLLTGGDRDWILLGIAPGVAGLAARWRHTGEDTGDGLPVWVLLAAVRQLAAWALSALAHLRLEFPGEES